MGAIILVAAIIVAGASLSLVGIYLLAGGPVTLLLAGAMFLALGHYLRGGLKPDA